MIESKVSERIEKRNLNAQICKEIPKLMRLEEKCQ